MPLALKIKPYGNSDNDDRFRSEARHIMNGNQCGAVNSAYSGSCVLLIVLVIGAAGFVAPFNLR